MCVLRVDGPGDLVLGENAWSEKQLLWSNFLILLAVFSHGLGGGGLFTGQVELNLLFNQIKIYGLG